MDHQGNPSIVLKRVKLRIWNWGGWRVLLLKGMLCFVLLINLHTVPNRKGLTSLKGFLGSSAGKESSCKAGDSSLIRGSGRSAREGIVLPTPRIPTSEFLGSPCGSGGKEYIRNAGDLVSSLSWEEIPTPVGIQKGTDTHSSILASLKTF